jgi:hypothetical protein
MANQYDTGQLSIADLAQDLQGDLRRAENSWQDAKEEWERTGDPNARQMMRESGRVMIGCQLQLKQLETTAQTYLNPVRAPQVTQEERYHRPILSMDAQDFRDIVHQSKYYPKEQDPLKSRVTRHYTSFTKVLGLHWAGLLVPSKCRTPSGFLDSRQGS